MLEIGSGGPGRLGFANATGSEIVWKPLVDKKCGVILSMNALDLDLIALPGARLPGGEKLPKLGGFNLACRGGPSYASTAWIWRAALDEAICIRNDIGSDRRLWLSLSLAQGAALHLCCVYLPPLNIYGGNEQAWRSELCWTRGRHA